MFFSSEPESTEVSKNVRKLQVDKLMIPKQVGNWKQYPGETKVFDINNNSKVFIDLERKPLIYCADNHGKLYLKGEA